MPSPAPEAIVITGATGTGKSELAVRVAERVDGFVISADSRQVYRHMDIGTAKPGPELTGRVSHYGLDLIDPDEAYSAGRFARDAWRWISGERERGRVPVVAGGTGFFIGALLSPLAPEPNYDAEHRDALRRYLGRRSVPELKRWLRRLDPARAGDLEGEGGAQRLARSIEVVLLSGKAHSWWLRQPPATPPLQALTFCLELPRSQLYERLDRRFEGMLHAGLLEEVRRVAERFGADAVGLRSVGYAELLAHLRGEMTLEEAIEAAKRSTRHLARRQITWFRHQLAAGVIRLDAAESVERLADGVVGAWRTGAGLAGGGERG